jgi:hypothetical protein
MGLGLASLGRASCFVTLMERETKDEVVTRERVIVSAEYHLALM